ncbi:hypothetical protein AAVH_39639, partial [Aphelenchoides avenae]
ERHQALEAGDHRSRASQGEGDAFGGDQSDQLQRRHAEAGGGDREHCAGLVRARERDCDLCQDAHGRTDG